MAPKIGLPDLIGQNPCPLPDLGQWRYPLPDFAFHPQILPLGLEEEINRLVEETREQGKKLACMYHPVAKVAQPYNVKPWTDEELKRYLPLLYKANKKE